MSAPAVAPDPDLERSIRAVERSATIAAATAAVVLGLIALLLPGLTLASAGFVFGIALVVRGIAGVTSAVVDRSLSRIGSIVSGVVGAAIVVLGVLCILDVQRSLFLIAVLVGVSWVMAGVADLLVAVLGGARGRVGLLALRGLLTIVGGIAVLLLPQVALLVFLRVGAVVLIAVGIATLLSLPRRTATAPTAELGAAGSPAAADHAGQVPAGSEGGPHGRT